MKRLPCIVLLVAATTTFGCDADDQSSKPRSATPEAAPAPGPSSENSDGKPEPRVNPNTGQVVTSPPPLLPQAGASQPGSSDPGKPAETQPAVIKIPDADVVNLLAEAALIQIDLLPIDAQQAIVEGKLNGPLKQLLDGKTYSLGFAAVTGEADAWKNTIRVQLQEAAVLKEVRLGFGATCQATKVEILTTDMDFDERIPSQVDNEFLWSYFGTQKPSANKTDWRSLGIMTLEAKPGAATLVLPAGAPVRELAINFLESSCLPAFEPHNRHRYELTGLEVMGYYPKAPATPGPAPAASAGAVVNLSGYTEAFNTQTTMVSSALTSVASKQERFEKVLNEWRISRYWALLTGTRTSPVRLMAKQPQSGNLPYTYFNFKIPRAQLQSMVLNFGGACPATSYEIYVSTKDVPGAPVVYGSDHKYIVDETQSTWGGFGPNKTVKVEKVPADAVNGNWLSLGRFSNDTLAMQTTVKFPALNADARWVAVAFLDAPSRCKVEGKSVFHVTGIETYGQLRDAVKEQKPTPSQVLPAPPWTNVGESMPLGLEEARYLIGERLLSAFENTLKSSLAMPKRDDAIPAYVHLNGRTQTGEICSIGFSVNDVLEDAVYKVQIAIDTPKKQSIEFSLPTTDDAKYMTCVSYEQADLTYCFTPTSRLHLRLSPQAIAADGTLSARTPASWELSIQEVNATSGKVTKQLTCVQPENPADLLKL